jgi:EAL domain-containing protein (putative c-di-GMP-specific phosphodiesterase class I)
MADRLHSETNAGWKQLAVDERLTAAEAEIARRTRQQAALAELGQAALTRADVGLLVGQTCALVEWALAASYVRIVEASGNDLTLLFGLGSNQTQLFASTMNRRYTERLELELELSLHRAIEREEFTLVYQPICDRATRQVRSFEALIRWNRPGHSMVNPADFIEIAEETRLILPIGDWVMRTACTQLRGWREQGIDGFSIGVNLSAHQVAQPHFIHSVHDTLKVNRLEPHDLELELTESAALQNLEWTLSVLDQLRSLGVGIAVDDFGTGQSSLVYLKRFPITTLKIDREFLRDVQREGSDAAIFRSIVQLGHSLGLYVIAEGIETHADRELVEQQQCDGMQGYHFSRPLRAEDVPAWMRAFNYPASVVA